MAMFRDINSGDEHQHIFGRVEANGQPAPGSEGFNSFKDPGDIYTIIFDYSFKREPSVVITPFGEGEHRGPQILALGSNESICQITGDDGCGLESSFTFIAFGEAG